MKRAALIGLVVLASFGLAAGDVDRMTLAGGRVSLDAPPELALARSPEQVLDTASPPPCDPGFGYCLYLPDSAYAGTNLRSAGLAVTRREDLRSNASCLLAQPEGWSDLQPAVVMREDEPPVATSHFGDVGQGAAGSFTIGEVVRLFDGTECWEFETRIARSRFENFPPGEVVEFGDADRAEVEAIFWSVLRSVAVEGDPVEWPTEASGDLSDFVLIDLPKEATSPLALIGEARGVWFFEGTFPVRLLAQDGTELATGIVTAQEDWMTEGFVPFEGEIEYAVDGPTPAVLILERDNPSGLPEHAAAARFELLLR